MIRWFTSLLCCVSLAHADEVDGWLSRMQQALDTQNFQGTLVIRQQDQLHAMRVVHGRGEGGKGSWDTLESMNGEHRRVIRRDAQVITLFPDKNIATRVFDNQHKSFPLPSRLLQNLAQLKQIYHLQLAGRDRVAGWPTQILEMVPKDQYRYGFRLWLSRDNGLLLRSDLIGEQGQVVEQVMYTQLTIMKQVPPPGVPDLNTWQVSELDAGQSQGAETAAVLWTVQQLPSGFKLVQASSLPATGLNPADTDGNEQQARVQHLIFSDGMTSVSVFVEQRAPESNVLRGVSRMGAVNAFGQSIKGFHVTVMGEVPLVTVRQIAQSIVQLPAATNSVPEAAHD